MLEKITWKISPQIAQYVRAALGRCPHDESRPIIDDLMQQAEQQERAAQEKEKTKGEIKAA